MTRTEMRAFAERQIEWHEKFLAHDEWELEYIKEELKRSRKADKELIEHIWAKGVLTKTDWYIWGDPDHYVSAETRKLMNRRQHVYRSRKRNLEWIEHYKKEVIAYS